MACVTYPPPPKPIEITVPGGAKISSQPTDTHDPCGPVNSIMTLASPAMAAIQPVLDIAGLGIALGDTLVCMLATIGALMVPTGNLAVAAMFPLPTIKNSANNFPIPGFPAGDDTMVPDFGCILEKFPGLLCYVIKMAGIIPHLSMLVTMKDMMNALMEIMSCVQAKLNSLADALGAVPANTGDPVIDAELECAREAIVEFQAHAAGPLSNVIPVVQQMAKMAEPIQRGLPGGVVSLVTLAVNLSIIPFPDQQSKNQFLGLIETLKKGIQIQIPDMTDISDIPVKMNEIRQSMGPVVDGIEQVTQLLEKLENC